MEENWSANDYRYYLAHHGILGQKWGQKNGPPYPLDAGDHSASEKKAGWKKSLGGVFKKKEKPQISNKAANAEHKTDSESERIKRYEADVKKANEAATDEEHDRLNRIADTRNTLKERSVGNYKYYDLETKNANFMLHENDDWSIDKVHKVQDNYETINSECTKAANDYINEWHKGSKIVGKPLVNIPSSQYKDESYGEIVTLIYRTNDGNHSGIDVEYDLRKKKLGDVSYND